jgi:lipoprotein-anchoring transpeptidase ErfK/SrfK
MSVRHTNLSRLGGRRSAAAVAGLLTVSLAVVGCSASAGEGAGPVSGTASSAPSAAPTAPPATISTNLAGGPVTVDTRLEVSAEHGTLDKVRVLAGPDRTRLDGRLSADRTSWTATQLLEPGLDYRLHAVASNPAERRTVENRRFHSEDLTLEQQTYPSIAPLAGETVGVGMPVIVRFDVPVQNKALFEKHLEVTSTPRQVGSWHWISDNEVHWRPRTYWQPGTDVTVTADLNSLPAGNGVYGQMSRTAGFHVGDSVISKVDVAAHVMRTFVNGKLARTIPVSAGKPGFTTRSGVKVIIEKFRQKRMDAATIGIDEGDPEYYDLSNVEYALRVTYSGEFMHAAPWSAGSQGAANVSHGCVGMSTADAAWLYGITKRGDVVDVTGSDRQMTLTNGYGDWNASFADYKQGSAVS